MGIGGIRTSFFGRTAELQDTRADATPTPAPLPNPPPADLPTAEATKGPMLGALAGFVGRMKKAAAAVVLGAAALTGFSGAALADTHFDAAQSKPASVYVVEKGDTLSEIARDHQVPLSTLLATNPQIRNPNLIHPGETVQLPKKVVNATDIVSDTQPAQLAQPVVDATPSAPQPEVERPSRPARWVQDILLERLERPLVLDRDWGMLGGQTTVKLETVAEETAYDPIRRAYADKHPGHEVRWLRTGGTLGWKAATETGADPRANLQLEGQFQVTRPYVWKGLVDPAALAATVGRSLAELPLQGEDALALPPGATFSVSGRLQGDTAAKFGQAWQGQALIKADAAVEVERLEGSIAKVVIRSENGARGTLAGSGPEWAADLAVHQDKERERRFVLDLNTPEGDAAYESLVRFDPKAATEKVAPEGSTYRREHGATVSGHRQVDATRVSGRLGYVATESESSGRRVATAGAALAHTVTPQTTATVGLEASSERSHNGWSVVREGRLAPSAGLRTVDGEKRLGFTGSASLDYRLALPAGTDAELPLDAAKARLLPPESRFVLIGDGKLGTSWADGHGVGRGSVTAGLDATVSGRLMLAVERGVNDQLNVTVTVARSAEAAGRLGWSRLDPGLAASFEKRSTRADESSATFALNLARPADRRAFEALLRGDLGPAERITGVQLIQEAPRLGQLNRLEASVTGLLSWVDSSLRLQQQTFDPRDPSIVYDTHRAAYAAQHPDTPWVKESGALAPKLKQEGAVSAGGGVNIRYGFSSDALVEYESFRPRGATDLGPPLAAEAALALPQGSEFGLVGRGSLRGTAGLGAGADWGATGLRVSATAGLDFIQTETGLFELRVKRLDGDQVRVTLERGERDESKLDLFARIGAQVDSPELLGVQSAVQQLSALRSLADRLDTALEKVLGLDFRHGVHRATESKRGASVVLDLGRAEARKTYESLMSLDASPVLRWAENAQQTGVFVERRSTEETRETGSRTALTAFGSKLYLSEALRRDTTRIEIRSGGDTTRLESVYQRLYEGIFGRKQDVRWEAVTVKTPDDPQGHGYYRLRFTDADPITSKEEVRRMTRLAHGLGAQEIRPARVEKDRSGLLPLLGSWGQHGRTKAEVEVFFTQAAIGTLRATDTEVALRTYGEGLRASYDGLPAWADPVKGPKARAILDEALAQERFSSDDSNHAESSRNASYWRLTGRNLWEDKADWQAAAAFATMVAQMRASEDPAAWNRAFADLGKAVDFDFFDAMAALGRITGSDQVLVHRLKIQGDKVDIEMRDEGRLETPRS